jgi:hypothetical protein
MFELRLSERESGAQSLHDCGSSLTELPGSPWDEAFDVKSFHQESG